MESYVCPACSPNMPRSTVCPRCGGTNLVVVGKWRATMERTEISAERISEIEDVLRRFFVAPQETIRSAAVAVIAVGDVSREG